MGRKPKNQINQTTNLENTENKPIIEEENLVKKTCRELGITQKELAELMGIHDVTVRHWSSRGDTPDLAKNFFKLLLERQEFINYIEKTKQMFSLFEEIKGVRIPDMNNKALHII